MFAEMKKNIIAVEKFIEKNYVSFFVGYGQANHCWFLGYLPQVCPARENNGRHEMHLLSTSYIGMDKCRLRVQIRRFVTYF